MEESHKTHRPHIKVGKDEEKKMRRSRLRWHGHVGGKDDADYVKACNRLMVEVPVCRPRKTRQNTVC